MINFFVIDNQIFVFINLGVVSTVVPDSPHKVFIGGLPNYLNEDQVCLNLINISLYLGRGGGVIGCISCQKKTFFNQNQLKFVNEILVIFGQ